MPDWAQIISDALDILKFDGATGHSGGTSREMGRTGRAADDERFDATDYTLLTDGDGAAFKKQRLSHI